MYYKMCSLILSHQIFQPDLRQYLQILKSSKIFFLRKCENTNKSHGTPLGAKPVTLGLNKFYKSARTCSVIHSEENKCIIAELLI